MENEMRDRKFLNREIKINRKPGRGIQKIGKQSLNQKDMSAFGYTAIPHLRIQKTP